MKALKPKQPVLMNFIAMWMFKRHLDNIAMSLHQIEVQWLDDIHVIEKPEW